MRLDELNLELPEPPTATTRRIKRLREAQYKMPNNLTEAMFDFYALYALWFSIGSGRREFGYPDGEIVNNRRGEMVDDWLHTSAQRFGSKLAQETLGACKDELENVEDEYLIPPQAYKAWADKTGDPVLMGLYSEEVHPWVKEFRDEYKLGNIGTKGGPVDSEEPVGKVTLPKNPLATLGVDRVMKIFMAPFWDTYAELYGGKAWAGILSHVLELVKALKSDNLLGHSGMIMAIDKLMDLEHNTGSLVSKIEGAPSKEALDLRARTKRFEDFAPYCSDAVAALLKGSAKFDKVAEWQDKAVRRGALLVS